MGTEKSSDLRKIDLLIRRMERAADEIKVLVPNFEWTYQLTVSKSKGPTPFDARDAQRK